MSSKSVLTQLEMSKPGCQCRSGAAQPWSRPQGYHAPTQKQINTGVYLSALYHTKATSKWVKRQTKTYDSETTRGQSHLALVQSKLLKKAVTAPKVTARPKSTEASAHRGSSAPVGVQPTALERIYQAFTAGLIVHNKKNSQFQIPKSN